MNDEKNDECKDCEIKERYSWCRKKDIQDLESGRITTRWDGIDSKIDFALSRVEDAAKVNAQARGLFTSPHEGYGHLAEKMSELLCAIQSRDTGSIVHDAVQLSAEALNLAATLIMWEGVPAKTLEDMKEDVDVEIIRDMLLLIDIEIEERVIEEWTPEERVAVGDYAGAVHLAASDNDVDIPETPECLTKVLIKLKDDRKTKL